MEREAEYVTAAQLRKPLHRPDIVARAIQLASAEAAVRKPTASSPICSPSPCRAFASHHPQGMPYSCRGRPAYGRAGETADPVKVVRIQVNGRQVAEYPPSNSGGFAAGPLQFAVPLANGCNTIRLTAVNETGESSAELPLTLTGNGDLDVRGTLYCSPSASTNIQTF